MLFAMGARFGGHALYVKDNRLHYVNSYVGSVEQMVVGSEDIPTGRQLILSAAFDKDGQEPDVRHRSALALPRRPQGRQRAGSRPSSARSPSPARACPSAGTSGEPVTQDYPGEPPYRFTGGTIDRVAVDVSGEPYLDLEREAALMLMRE